MKLLTKEIIKKTPSLYAQENETDPMVYAKFFDPCSHWTWYLMELDEETGRCFGYVVGFEEELGYFDIPELENVKNKLGIGIERDTSFEPTRLSEIKKLK